MSELVAALARAMAFCAVVGGITWAAMTFTRLGDPHPAIVTCGERVDTVVDVYPNWGALRYETGDGKAVRAPSSCIVDYLR